MSTDPIMEAVERLMEAAQQGDVNLIQMMIDSDPRLLEARKENGESPLMVALYHGRREVVEMMIERAVPLNIHEAAAVNDADTLRELLQEEPRLLELESHDGWTPLHLAAFFGAYETAKLLLKCGADVNARSTNRMQNTPLHAATAGRKYALVRLLLENDADVNAQQRGGWTAIHQAAAHADAELCQLLLDAGAKVDVRSDEGQTPLDIAVEKEYAELVPLLSS